MNAGQYEGIMRRLGEILDRMPVQPDPDPVPFTTHHLDGTKTVTVTGRPPVHYRLDSDGKQAASLALYCLLVNLDAWIQGAKENHQALEHLNENTGEECWREFAPADIRSMVNDVARDLGLTEFGTPEHPEEDKTL